MESKLTEAIFNPQDKQKNFMYIYGIHIFLQEYYSSMKNILEIKKEPLG